MATGSSSTLPRALIEHQPAEHKETMKTAADRSRKIGFSRGSGSYFSLLNSISSPNSSGFFAFSFRSPATVADSFCSFGTTLL
jgi:hypothetical protein